MEDRDQVRTNKQHLSDLNLAGQVLRRIVPKLLWRLQTNLCWQ